MSNNFFYNHAIYEIM